MEVDLGFERQGLLGADVSPPIPRGPERADRVREFFARAAETARAIPGVTHVALSAQASLPLYRGFATTRITSPASDQAPVEVDQRQVSGDYFAVAGIQIVRGRTFAEHDHGRLVAVTDEIAARHLFADRDPLGQVVTRAGREDYTVIGVAENVRLRGPEGLAQAQFYRQMEDEQVSRTLLVRTSAPPEQIALVLQAQLTSLLPAKASRVTVDVVEEQYRALTADRRFNAGMMSVLGILALVIGVGGIYASTATIVAQRTKEIGIRMALGSTTRRVVQSVTLEAGRLLLIGTVIGAAAAWAASGAFGSIVFGLEPTALVGYAVPVVLIAAGGAVAALLPARRAARIDPLVTLRSE
jgi:ABC-type antimicrobial peptide transport system permease subunit